MFSTIDRYILKQVTVPLLASFSIGLLMLLAERLVRLLDVTLGKQNSFSVIFELLAYLIPHYLGTAIPAALFLGLLFGFSKLSKNQELDAMMASGFGLHRLSRPTLFLAFLFALFSFGIFGWLQPYTRYAYRAVMFEIQNVDAFYLAEEGVFMQAGRRTFILDKLNRSINTFDGVFVYELKDDGGSETLTANSGSLINVEGDPRPVLRLETGRRLQVKTDEKKKAHINEFVIGEFERTDTPLGKISKSLFRPRGADERELTISELLTFQQYPSPKYETRELSAEFHHRLVNMAIMLVLPLLALPFSIGRARSPRGYKLGVALALLIAFHEIIEQGALAAKTGAASPLVSLWLPAGLLAVFAAIMFYRTAFLIPRNTLDQLFLGINNFFTLLLKRFRRKVAT